MGASKKLWHPLWLSYVSASALVALLHRHTDHSQTQATVLQQEVPAERSSTRWLWQRGRAAARLGHLLHFRQLSVNGATIAIKSPDDQVTQLLLITTTPFHSVYSPKHIINTTGGVCNGGYFRSSVPTSNPLVCLWSWTMERRVVAVSTLAEDEDSLCERVEHLKHLFRYLHPGVHMKKHYLRHRITTESTESESKSL